MTNDKDKAKAENAAAAGQQSQLQSGSADPGKKVENDPAKKVKEDGETQFFDTTIAKVITDEDGNEKVVMSDFLAPGEKLKREVDAEKAEQKAKDAEKAAKDNK